MLAGEQMTKRGELKRPVPSGRLRWEWAVALLFLMAGCGSAYLKPVAGTGRGVIDRCEYLDVAGARLYLLIRGADRGAPVLLWLHGGPGGAERPLSRYYNHELEDHFVVAYWDQRGAGALLTPMPIPGIGMSSLDWRNSVHRLMTP